MSGQKGNGVIDENAKLVNEASQGSEIDPWDEAKLAALVNYDGTPEVTSAGAFAREVTEEEALSLTENIVSQSELFDDPVEGKTKPIFSKSPLAKAGAVGLPLLLLFGGGGLFLSGVMGSKHKQVPKVVSQSTPQVASSVTPTPDTQTGNLKTQLAVGSQEKQIKDLEKSRSPKTNVPQTQTPKTQKTGQTPSSKPPRAAPTSYTSTPPRTVASYTAPPTPSFPSRTSSPTPSFPSQSPPAPVRQPAALVASSPAPAPESPKSSTQQLQKPQQLDPMQQWMALSQLGSYGSSELGKTTTVSRTATSAVFPASQIQMASPKTITIPRAIPVLRAATGGVPFPGVPASANARLPSGATSVPSPIKEDAQQDDAGTRGHGDAERDVSQDPRPERKSQGFESPTESGDSLVSFQEGLQSPSEMSPRHRVSPSPRLFREEAASSQVNPAEEANLLSGVPMRFLQVGGTAQGQLVTPVIWTPTEAGTAARVTTQESPGEQKFVVQLTQALTDNEGSATLPQGTQIIAQVVDVNESGLAQLSVTQAVVDGQEYMLPAGAISIRGDDGQPLIASLWRNQGGANASGDITSFVFGALSKVGQVLIQPDSQTSTSINGNGISSSTLSQSGGRDLLGAVLDGGFTPLVQQIKERNEQRLHKLKNRPNVWYVPDGTNVQVFVNQSFEF